jgi:hypothetical protein
MDPQMSSVLAGRVALERLATVEHEQHARSRRRFGSLARLARRSVTLVAGLTSARSRGSARSSISTLTELFTRGQ